MRDRFVAMIFPVLQAYSSAQAAGDFPLASCKGWNGTVIERDGIDTTSAVMRGIITKADIQEYCERDPGGETKQYGGKLTIAQCVTSYLKSEGKTRLAARANCRIGFVEYQYGKRSQGRAEFPLVRDADTSCASGMPPLIQQFKMLCPTAAKRLALE